MYRDGSSPKGACPRCYQPLDAVRLGGHSAQGCRRCGGLFVDVPLSARIATALDRAVLSDAFTHARGKPKPRLDLHAPTLSCPECSLPMAMNYVKAAHVRIDACASHGTFFDAHELEAVARAFRRQREAGVRPPTAPYAAPHAPTAEPALAPEEGFGDGLKALLDGLTRFLR